MLQARLPLRSCQSGCGHAGLSRIHLISDRAAVKPHSSVMLKYFSSFREKFSHSDGTSPSAFSGDLSTETDSPKAAQSRKLVLQLRTAAICLPHPDKVHYGGEDAFFISPIGGGALGVADGVGGWAESGVNPAEYSRTLMRMACAYLEGQGIFAPNPDDPRDVLPRLDPMGALNAAHLNTKVAGSATACVMQLDTRKSTLEAANLGDSGFIVYRGGKVLAKTRPLQHYFDCPFQFGAYPEFVEATDTVDMAEIYSIPLVAGDVIVAGSDGLWDNCYDTEVLEMLPREPSAVQAAANRIAHMARAHAEDMDYQSPYIREALAQGLDLPWWDKVLGATFRNGRFQFKQLSGGKIDDITVMVSLVEEVAEAPPMDLLTPTDSISATSFVTAASQPSASTPETPPATIGSAPASGQDTGSAFSGAAVPPVASSSPVPSPDSANRATAASHLNRSVTLTKPVPGP